MKADNEFISSNLRCSPWAVVITAVHRQWWRPAPLRLCPGHTCWEAAVRYCGRNPSVHVKHIRCAHRRARYSNTSSLAWAGREPGHTIRGLVGGARALEPRVARTASGQYQQFARPLRQRRLCTAKRGSWRMAESPHDVARQRHWKCVAAALTSRGKFRHRRGLSSRR